MPNEGRRMLFLSRLSFPRSIYLSALPQRLLSLDAINPFPPTPPCSLSWAPSSPCSCGNPLWGCALAYFSWLYLCCTGEQEPSHRQFICGLPLTAGHSPALSWPMSGQLWARSCPGNVVLPTLHTDIPGSPLSPTWLSSPWGRTGSCCMWVWYLACSSTGTLHSIVPRPCGVRGSDAGTRAPLSRTGLGQKRRDW